MHAVIRNTMNTNISSAVFPTSAALVGSIGSLTISLLGTFMNTLLIIAIVKYKTVHTIPNVLIIQMCVTDILFCTIIMPIFGITDIAKTWLFGELFCRLFGFMNFFIGGMTLMNLIIIALSRYCLVAYPYHYQKLFNKRCTVLMSMTCSIFIGVLLVFPLTETWGKFGYIPQKNSCSLISLGSVGNGSFNIFVMLLAFVIPLAGILTCYILIFVVVWRQSNKLVNRTQTSLRDFSIVPSHAVSPVRSLKSPVSSGLPSGVASPSTSAFKYLAQESRPSVAIDVPLCPLTSGFSSMPITVVPKACSSVPVVDVTPTTSLSPMIDDTQTTSLSPVTDVTTTIGLSSVTHVIPTSTSSPVTDVKITSSLSPVTNVIPITPLSPVTCVIPTISLVLSPVTDVTTTIPSSPVTDVKPSLSLSPLTDVIPTTSLSNVTDMIPTTHLSPVTDVVLTTSFSPAINVPIVQVSSPRITPNGPLTKHTVAMATVSATNSTHLPSKNCLTVPKPLRRNNASQRDKIKAENSHLEQRCKAQHHSESTSLKSKTLAELKENKIKAELMLTKTMLIIALVFIACYLPRSLMAWIDNEVRYPLVHRIGTIMTFLYSLMNSIVYLILNKSMLSKFARLFRNCCRCYIRVQCTTVPRPASVHPMYPEQYDHMCRHAGTVPQARLVPRPDPLNGKVVTPSI
ncbi:unnamed protein product [Owenia fusiformis]|uniref:Uncharacterized protein n=1 Tax=Owenia fusiformis TaxID=6347 RepID=A0A8J1TZC3_OWEFU|nr:unnamed protein product [Owenia fusiformis]